MTVQDIQDVVVIGGGPAGSSAGSFLAMKGHRVTVLEKEAFPRDHVGESLLPFCYRLFEKLGVLEEMSKRFVRKPGVRFVDVNGRTATTWCFNHVIHDETYLSFQVARGDFDKLLLDNTRRHGATVREQTKVDRVDLDRPDGLVEVQATGPSGEKESYLARFLLDCSGRNALLASQRGMIKKYKELDRTALWTHWHVPELCGGLEEGLSLIIYIGGEKKGWLWIFPLGPNWLTVGVVMNNDYLRSQKTQLQKNGSDDWRMGLYMQELGFSPFAQMILEHGKITQPLTIEGDYSYYTESKYGQNYAMIGDAAQFIDPIFSSGVYLAINSSRLVTDALHKKLTGVQEDTDPLDEAYSHINGAYKMVFKLINFFYSANTINFAQMGQAEDLIHQQHQSAMAVGHFLLAGDFFDRYDHYSKVVDMLHNERMYNRYRKLVNEREDFAVSSCGVDEATAFHELVNPGAEAD